MRWRDWIWVALLLAMGVAGWLRVAAQERRITELERNLDRFIPAVIGAAIASHERRMIEYWNARLGDASDGDGADGTGG